MFTHKVLVTLITLFFLNIKGSATNVDSLKIKAQNSFNMSKVEVINQVVDYYLNSDVDSAITYSKLAIRISSLSGSEGKVSAINKLAFAFYIKNNTDSAITYANEALNLSRNLEYNLGKAQSSNILGLTEWRIGAYPKAVDHYLKALDFATLANDSVEIAKSNNYLGLVYWKTGNYPKSINYFYNSLEIKQELNNSYEEALTLNNLSNIHNEIGDYQQAIMFAQKALKISENNNSKYTLGRALGNLGMSYLKMNKTKKALEYLNRALLVKKESGEVKGLGYTLIDVGNIHSKLKDFEKAKELYDEAFVIMTKTNDAHGLSTVLNKLAKIYFEENRFKLALSSLDKSNKYAERENLKDNIKENFLLYSQIYEKQGKSKKALENYKFHAELKDYLVNENINSRIKELNINYETNQKEKENELLKQSNTIQSLELEKQKQYIVVLLVGSLLAAFLIGGIVLRYNYLNKTKKITEQKNKKIERQKVELKQLNATKDKFFSILAHDLKNPFQTILGYSTLLADDYETLKENEKKNIVDQILGVSKSSYQLLENLLSWANTQTNRIEYLPEKYNLEEITLDTIEPIKIQAERKNQNLNVTINSSITVFTDVNIYSTILRNLITNAVKFSKIGGNIKVEAKEREGEIFLCVEDFGDGMSSKKIENLFTLKTSKNSEGTALESGTGLGLVLCRELVEIYNGEIWVESELTKGSKFYFTIPKSSV